MEIIPINHSLKATVRVPGSKSLTNRALLIAALGGGTTRMTNALFSDDSCYFAKALQTLGFDVRLDESEREMSVEGLGGEIPSASAELYVGNAGTAARFLTAFLTLGHGYYDLDGDTRMRERPIQDLVEALAQLGGQLNTTQDHLPLRIAASGLPGGRTTITGDISSQFLSALLMIAPYTVSGVKLDVVNEMSSKPYVDMSIAVMDEFGVQVERDGYRSFTIQPGAYSPIPTYAIESDASGASYFFAAPAVCGGRVLVKNISRRSIQGDIGFLDVLASMGCTVREHEDGIELEGAESLTGIDVDMRDIPDTAQTLAAIAPFASTPTRIRGIASARGKETDRVKATSTELARLGVRVEEHADGMTIHPCEHFRPASVQTYNDHRMAMAFSLIGLRVPGVFIENPGCVSKTFPEYFQVLDSLR